MLKLIMVLLYMMTEWFDWMNPASILEPRFLESRILLSQAQKGTKGLC